MAKQGRIYIGIGGWTFAPWRGVFYPKGLAHKRELSFASRAVDSIEVNGSFYSLLRPSSVEGWFAETPDDFVFALKGSRFITHMKRLANVEAALANFFASGLLALGHKIEQPRREEVRQREAARARPQARTDIVAVATPDGVRPSAP